MSVPATLWHSIVLYIVRTTVPAFYQYQPFANANDTTSSTMSDDSSDDDLLQSPIFKKKPATRRGIDRVEKNKLDFFDACLKGSDARTDVHRRIAEVDLEFGLKTEQQQQQQQQGQDDQDGYQKIQREEVNDEGKEKNKDESDDDDEILLTDLGRLAEEAEAQNRSMPLNENTTRMHTGQKLIPSPKKMRQKHLVVGGMHTRHEGSFRMRCLV